MWYAAPIPTVSQSVSQCYTTPTTGHRLTRSRPSPDERVILPSFQQRPFPSTPRYAQNANDRWVHDSQAANGPRVRRKIGVHEFMPAASAGAPWIEWCHECPDAQVISAIITYDLGDYYL